MKQIAVIFAVLCPVATADAQDTAPVSPVPIRCEGAAKRPFSDSLLRVFARLTQRLNDQIG